MSWVMKDTKAKAPSDPSLAHGAPPVHEYGDSEALPTYLAGMSDWDGESADAQVRLDEQRDLPDNWLSTKDWSLWAKLCRRGTVESGDAPQTWEW